MKLGLNKIIVTATVAIGLASCATPPQTPISFSQQSLSGPKEQIGVVSTKIPSVSVDFPGADCLLCIGVAMAAHSTFREHASTLNAADLENLQDELVAKLKARGYRVARITEAVDVRSLDSVSDKKDGFAKYNFAKYKKDGYTALVVTEYKSVGFRRGYQSYIPTEPMKASLQGETYMVRIEDGKLLWFQPHNLSKGVVGEWDQPPKFPGLTNSYYSLLEEYKDIVLGSFK